MEYHKTFTGQNENHDIRNTNNTMTLNTNIDETVTKLGKQVVVFQTKKGSPLEKVKRNKERGRKEAISVPYFVRSGILVWKYFDLHFHIQEAL